MRGAVPMHKRLQLPALAAFALLSGCASLPATVERAPSTMLSMTQDTPLGGAIAAHLKGHPGLTGIQALSQGRDAFAVRVLLARAAQRSLDLQYYIWHGDSTGQLLAQAAWEAAERGVRVRMLLDDANTSGLDGTLSALDAHPSIEVRVFNPFPSRRFRLADFVADFERLNRRMHNKSLTADNQATIVGGRNVGNEYYGADLQVGFADLDVLAIGPVVEEVSRQFDQYWNDASAYPIASLVRQTALPDARKLLQQQWEQVNQQPETQDYLRAVRETSAVRDLLAGKLAFDWSPARLVNDDPSKITAPSDRTDMLLLPRLAKAMGRPTRELDLVSPYFVPGKEGTKGLAELARNGIAVRVLTNSLSATDVGPVHAGYAKYREDLLRAGVRVYELKRSSEAPARKDREPNSGPGSSGDVSLHAKTFAVDRARIFVGSFNLDPRSANLNTEMGVVIESPVLAARMSDELTRALPAETFELRLSADGRSIEWLERTAGGDKIHTSEPEVGLLRRMWVEFLSWLPIEWML